MNYLPFGYTLRPDNSSLQLIAKFMAKHILLQLFFLTLKCKLYMGKFRVLFVANNTMEMVILFGHKGFAACFASFSLNKEQIFLSFMIYWFSYIILNSLFTDHLVFILLFFVISFLFDSCLIYSFLCRFFD